MTRFGKGLALRKEIDNLDLIFTPPKISLKIVCFSLMMSWVKVTQLLNQKLFEK
ncbi:MAG: hypothetical protein K2X27_20850 [Candidatus Obscuribacterales bacterium]|nr:hypothetical protein [Candidatus Obscuribacterales bacterium]